MIVTVFAKNLPLEGVGVSSFSCSRGGWRSWGDLNEVLSGAGVCPAIDRARPLSPVDDEDC